MCGRPMDASTAITVYPYINQYHCQAMGGRTMFAPIFEVNSYTVFKINTIYGRHVWRPYPSTFPLSTFLHSTFHFSTFHFPLFYFLLSTFHLFQLFQLFQLFHCRQYFFNVSMRSWNDMGSNDFT